MVSSLLSLSSEALRNIVLYAEGALGPPHGWYTLVRCSKALRLRLDVPAMHALLFARKFEVPTGVCHLLLTHAKLEMQRRFTTLNFFRRGVQCMDDCLAFTDALWVAYVMLEADGPRQMNVDQLLWAGLPELLLLYLKRRLNDGAENNHGWPLCNETNSLVIALMWLLSSESSVKAESTATRDEVMERLRPYVLAAFRYPLSSVQGWCPGPNSTFKCSPISKTAHGVYPPPTLSSREVCCFGTRAVQVPSVPIYAILSYFARLDMLTPMFPVHLLSAPPPKTGPRREDVDHFINECRTPFEPWDIASHSATSPFAGDPLALSFSRPYIPGALSGRWMGSSLIPCTNDYRHWLNEPEAPETMDAFCRQPLYLTLQEHFCYDNTQIRGPSPGRDCEKELDARLPTLLAERDDGIEVSDDSFRRFYKTYRGDVSRPETIVDVLVTGQTDDPYASAWGAFKIFGRIRCSDGLIVLRRDSVAGLGTTIFRGYMTSHQNFAGRYRGVDRGCEAAEWEAAFSLCKMPVDGT
ncbi:hypothetical protein GGX14DRAFT_662887 [Mycena pura]|uniref:Uncharacterized protein n=1 Tax=Mycena pura TaxID=153505 RepID=A0AAD6VU37_9AGAR|nr:hypothetical protein GGX14DRAFT_662887 [Mycena pura]